MKKKILSLFLAVMMVVSAFAAVAVSADTAECSYTVDGGTATSGKLSDAIAACTAGKVVVVTLNNCTLAEGATYTVAGDLTINGGTMQNVGLKQSTASKITLNNVTMTKNSAGNQPFLQTTKANSAAAAEYFTANNCTFKTVGDSASWCQFIVARNSHVTFNSSTIEADGKVSNAAVNKDATAPNTSDLTENQGACFTFWNSGNKNIGYLYLNDVVINTPNDTYGLINVMSLDGTLRTYGSRIYMTNVKYDAAGTEMDFDTNKVLAQADGASVRTVEGTEGLRFSTTISKGAYEYADKVVWTSEFKHIVYSGNAIDAEKKIGETVASDMGKRPNADGSVTYSVALVNIKDNTQVYSVQAEAKYEIVGAATKIYIYTPFDTAKNSRSIQQVAEAALDDVKTIQVEADAFPYAFEIKIGDKSYYSRYTAAQYEVLKKFAGADYTFTAPTAN